MRWRRLSKVLLSLLVVCAACGVCVGQSGRRAGRGGDSASSQQTTAQKDGAAVSDVNGVEAPKLSLLVLDYFPSDDVPANIPREIVQSFKSRLHERYASIAVASERDVNRAQALERARKVQRVFVVWLQVQQDAPPVERAKQGAGDEDTALALTYIVFMPGTAEIKTEGRVYYQPLNEGAQSGNRGRRRPPVRLPAEETLEGVGRAAADRVLAAFKDLLPQP